MYRVLQNTLVVSVCYAEAKSAHLQHKLESLRQRLQANKESEAADQAMQSRLEQLQLTHTQELSSANADLERLQLTHTQSVDSMRSELGEVSSQHAAASTQLQELQQERDVAVSEAQEASKSAIRLGEAEEEVKRLQTSQAELTQQLSSAHTQLAEVQQQLESAQGDMTRSGGERQQLSAAVERLEADIASAQAAKQDLVSGLTYQHQLSEHAAMGIYSVWRFLNIFKAVAMTRFPGKPGIKAQKACST